LRLDRQQIDPARQLLAWSARAGGGDLGGFNMLPGGEIQHGNTLLLEPGIQAGTARLGRGGITGEIGQQPVGDRFGFGTIGRDGAAGAALGPPTT
jgi:hypothetical protein